jgi:hypothetical protein
MLFPGNACDVCGPENLRPAGSWNGWVTKSDCIMDRPPMMFVSFSYLPLFLINSELFTFMSKDYVCNNGPYGDLMLICKALWTLLREGFNAYVRSSLC